MADSHGKYTTTDTDELLGTPPDKLVARKIFFDALKKECPEVLEDLRDTLFECYKKIIIGLYGNEPKAQNELIKLEVLKPGENDIYFGEYEEIHPQKNKISPLKDWARYKGWWDKENEIVNEKILPFQEKLINWSKKFNLVTKNIPSNIELRFDRSFNTNESSARMKEVNKEITGEVKVYKNDSSFWIYNTILETLHLWLVNKKACNNYEIKVWEDKEAEYKIKMEFEFNLLKETRTKMQERLKEELNVFLDNIEKEEKEKKRIQKTIIKRNLEHYEWLVLHQTKKYNAETIALIVDSKSKSNKNCSLNTIEKTLKETADLISIERLGNKNCIAKKLEELEL